MNAKTVKQLRKRVRQVVKDYDDTNFLALLMSMPIHRRILFSIGIIFKNNKLSKIYEKGKIVVK